MYAPKDNSQTSQAVECGYSGGVMSELDQAHLGAHLIPEAIQLLLAYNACVAEPAPVWLYARAGKLFRLQIL